MRKPFGSNQKYSRPETAIEKARRLNTVPAAMADVMIERRAGDGSCSVDDLASAGFTAAEILEFADDARALARGASVREAA